MTFLITTEAPQESGGSGGVRFFVDFCSFFGTELRPFGRFWRFGKVLLGQNRLKVVFWTIFQLNLGPCWGHVEAVSGTF